MSGTDPPVAPRQILVEPDPRRGFALVVVVVLLSLLVLLLVGLAVIARVESRVVENRSDLGQAKRHAMIGFQRALGELQRHAGPDRCATTRASFLPGVDANRSQWTGVWRAGTAAPVWLVSTPADLPADPTSADWRAPVVLVGAATAEVSGYAQEDPDQVRVETVPIAVPRTLQSGWTDGDDPVVGRFAFWVSDEGVKPSLIVRDDRWLAAGIGGSAPWPGPEPGLMWGGLDLEDPALSAALGRVLAYAQLGYADAAFTTLRMKRNYHRTTLTALGVLSNSAAGSLKAAAAIDGGNPYEPGGEPAYDALFLPQAPAAEDTEPRALPAARFVLRRRNGAIPTPDQLTGPELAAHGFVAGAFNLNGIDPDSAAQRQTWRIILAAARTLTLEDGTVRELTAGELEALATQFTASRLRAGYAGTGKAEGEPFRNLDDFARSSVLTDALAATPINDGRLPDDPHFVSARHVLALLAPILGVRSDTFTIRAYGEARNPLTGASLAEAWCEAQVQRLPDYVDPVNAPTDSPSDPDNLAYGRRFIVTAFRWLTPVDI